MKRVAALTALLAIGVLACNQLPIPPACTAATVLPASSVVVDGADPIVKSANVKTIDPASIDAVEANRLLTDPTGLAVGDTIASNCNTGIIRKISKITTTTGASGGLRPQDISKVYIETTPASLEGAIQKGTADMDFGSLDFGSAEISPANLAPGVTVQRHLSPQDVPVVTLEFLNRQFNLPNSAGFVKVSGNLENNLNPVFRLQFKDNAVDVFQIGLKGSLKLNLTGEFSANLGINRTQEIQLLKKPLEYSRTFTLGAVPVVVVVTLEPIIGYDIAVGGKINAKATISPTLSMDYGLKYVRTANPKWIRTFKEPSIAVPASFGYTFQANGTGEAFVKLRMGVKVYGVAGPNIESKAFTKLQLNPSNQNPAAVLTIGALATGTLAFDLNVLGVGVSASLPPLELLNKPQSFNCTTSQCQ